VILAAGIPAIILAAGKSTRMGRPKALLPIGADDTFLTHLVATFRAAGIDDVVVVVGYEAPAIVEAVQRRDALARVVVNENYESGQLSSLVAGLRVVDRPGVVAAMMALVDVPLVSASTIAAIVERYHATRAPIVRPVGRGKRGHPVLIDRALFDELRRSDPSQGAKGVVRAHTSIAGDVEVDDEGAFVDVDTPSEYDAMMARMGLANQDRPRGARGRGRGTTASRRNS
jgi:molybdenum cofactor cytidylyltransferase